MATTETQLFPPPTQSKLIDKHGKATPSHEQYLFTLQGLVKLRKVDTSGGNYAENVPPAGTNGATGQSNQNQEIVYKKTSADANTFTLNGTSQSPLPEGPLTLSAQYASFRIKSDGTSWWKVD